MIFTGLTQAQVEAATRRAELESERDEIDKSLERINFAAIRPLQSKAAGKGKQADDDKLVALETEAEALRIRRTAIVAELAAM